MLPDLEFLDELADASARETLPRFRADIGVDNKIAGDFDPVTEADRAAERAIRDLIGRRFPDHGIIGEEYGAEGADREFVWVIDPVDGTRAFISGLPVWGTLVGLYRDGRAVMGLIDQPFTGERYVAGPEGAFSRFRGGARNAISTRKATGLDKAIMMTTSPWLYGEVDFPVFRDLEASVKLSRYGCDCYAFAMLAAGHVDICIESGLHVYDIAGLIAPIEQAGGVVTDWSGGRPEEGGNIVACGSAELHAEVLETLNRPR